MSADEQTPSSSPSAQPEGSNDASRASADKELRAPVQSPTPRSGVVNAKKDVGTVAQAAVAGAAQAVASTAVVGAASGGSGAIAAAGIGALKSAGAAFLQTKTGRAALAAVLVIALVVPVGGLALTAAAVYQSVGAIDAAMAQVSSDGLGTSPQDRATARGVVDGTNVPWEFFVAVGPEMPEDDWDVGDLSDALVGAEPDPARWDLRLGLLPQPGSAVFRDATDEDPDGEARQELQEQVHQVYLAAMGELGLDESQAERVWSQMAQAVRGSQTCDPGATSSPPLGSGVESSAGSGVRVGDIAALSAEQESNVQAIIGIAKTMSPDHWEHLATTALAIAYTETRFRVMANDGVIDHDYERARMSEWPADGYAVVARSLQLDHQGVGSQYYALGMFQQMANGSWGASGDSTWESDPDGVIGRLMTAEWSAYAFMDRAMQVDGWATMSPAALGETVQVSGSNAAEANVAHGRSALEAFSDAPAVALPDGAAAAVEQGSEQGVGCDPAAGGGTGTWGEVVGGFAIPIAAAANSSYGPRTPVCGSFGCTPGFHDGTDFSAACNTPIYAAAAGSVSRVFQDQAGAWIIEVTHGEGLMTWYAHMEGNGVFVEQGDQVEAGEEIGGVGSSGMSTGCHLHFEVIEADERIDPVAWMRSVGLDPVMA